jgi:NitT/TauT family transport system substrate-binding protein
MGLGDVTLRPMPLEAMPAALARGEVAAAALFPPFSEDAVRRAGVRPLFTSREIPGEIFDVLVVDPALLASRRAVLVRLLRTWQSAFDELRHHPQASIASMARREGVSPAAFSASLQGLVLMPLVRQQPLFTRGGQLERNLRELRAVQAELGLMSDRASLPPVDGSLIREALRSAD